MKIPDKNKPRSYLRGAYSKIDQREGMFDSLTSWFKGFAFGFFGVVGRAGMVVIHLDHRRIALDILIIFTFRYRTLNLNRHSLTPFPK